MYRTYFTCIKHWESFNSYVIDLENINSDIFNRVFSPVKDRYKTSEICYLHEVYLKVYIYAFSYIIFVLHEPNDDLLAQKRNQSRHTWTIMTFYFAP